MRRDLDDQSVFALMTASPAAIAVFISFKLHCIGCPMAPFHTIADAGELHDADVEALRAAIEDVAREDTVRGRRR